MTLRQQLEHAAKDARKFSDALSYVVRGMVKWSEPKFVAPAYGMPRKKVRIGIPQGASDPFVIVHNMEEQFVGVLRPDQVADWPWMEVDEFPGLADFLRRTVDLEAKVNFHTPSEAWLRKETGVKG